MNSVTDLEMAVSASFSSILNEIQLSNLNFKIQMTPFAAHITLKKSALQDRNGIYAIPSPPILFLLQAGQQDILNLKHEIFELKTAICDSNKKKEEAEHNLEKVYAELNKSLSMNKDMKKELKKKEERVEANDQKIAALENAKKNLKIETENLNNQIKHASKAIKTNEKETTKSQVKIENLTQTVANLQNENKLHN